MTKKIVVDTNILFWAILDGKSERRPHLPPRAKALLNDLGKDTSIKVVIPSIVVAELICGLPEERRHSVLAEISKRFIISDFDPGAALYYGDIYYAKKVIGTLPPQDNERRYAKADIMIVAGAKACDAALIYSEDADIQFFGEGYIPVYKMPEVNEQQTLFDPADLEN